MSDEPRNPTIVIDVVKDREDQPRIRVSMLDHTEWGEMMRLEHYCHIVTITVMNELVARFNDAYRHKRRLAQERANAEKESQAPEAGEASVQTG